MILYLLALVAAGLVSGFLSGLYGVGGGIVLIPFFLFVFERFGISHAVVMHLAVGTSLALVIPTSMAASWRQLREQNLDVDYFRTWALWVLLGVVGGALTLPFVTTTILECSSSCFSSARPSMCSSLPRC